MLNGGLRGRWARWGEMMRLDWRVTVAWQMIGRPLHRTLRRTADKNTQRESSEGRTRTGDTRLMKPLL